MSVLGLREWFATGPAGHSTSYARGRPGLHHLAFLGESRAVVRDAYEWARSRQAVILDEPHEFPRNGEHCYATYWLDPHGFKLEAVCHSPDNA
jgi:catechol 2,3-dioxygenase-like lactoylglutathione lyase family enzyme